MTEQSNQNNKKTNLLLIDKDPLYLDKLQKELESKGINPFSISDPEKCLTICKNHKFRVIVIEIIESKTWNDFLSQLAKLQPQAKYVINLSSCPAKAKISEILGTVFNCINKDDSLNCVSRIIQDTLYNQKQAIKYPQELMEMVNKNKELIKTLEKRKVNPKKLKDEVNKWYKLVDKHGDGFWEYNPKDQSMYISRETKETLGYDDDEFENSRQNWLAHVHADDLGWTLNYMKVFLNSDQQFVEFNFRIRHKLGHYLWMRLRGKKLLDSNNNIFKIIGIHTDISDQKEEEIKNRQLEKLKILSDFSGKISHELNNYLSGIMGYADLLDEYIRNNLDIHQEPSDYLREIKKAIRKSSNITQNLVSFASKAESYSIPIKINQILDDLSNLIIHSSRDIEIVSDYQAGELEILGDMSRIKNALLNVMLNAKEAIQDSGKIEIKTSTVYLNKDKFNFFEIERGKYLKISIKDNVGSLTEEIKEKIFEPFFTTKKDQGNIGMGMATVFNIIKMHKGCVDIQTIPEKETEVSLFIPVQNQFFSTDNEFEIEESNEEKTILLIDDESFIRKVVSRILTKEGFRVITCKDGQEGVDSYQSLFPEVDLILLDLIMPNKDGEKTFYELKEINPDLKVIFISGFVKNCRIDSLLAAGGKGFLKKPFGKRELLTTINEQLNSFS
jgi:two-component system cell cycle sensor histidine kinase/response regulator CckA